MSQRFDRFFAQFSLEDLEDTQALGQRIAAALKPGDFVGLAGNLGAGKTTLARAVLGALGCQEDVQSPTFNLVLSYDIERFSVVHADLYRIKAPREVRELGLDEALELGVVILEWPDRMGPYLPGDRLDVILELDDGTDVRRVKIIGRGDWVDRVNQLTPPGSRS